MNRAVYGVIDDATLFARFPNDSRGLQVDRRSKLRKIASQHLRVAGHQPIWYWHALRYATKKLWQMKSDLVAARGRAHKLSSFVQNFMDADNLDSERVKACSFIVMTPNGPMSMCEHNSRRGKFILQPVLLRQRDRTQLLFEPLPDAKSRSEAKPQKTAGVAGYR